MNLFIKTEVEPQMQEKKTYGYQGIKGEGDKFGDCDRHIHTTIYKIDNQCGCIVQHRDLCLILCNELYEKI